VGRSLQRGDSSPSQSTPRDCISTITDSGSYVVQACKPKGATPLVYSVQAYSRLIHLNRVGIWLGSHSEQRLLNGSSLLFIIIPAIIKIFFLPLSFQTRDEFF